MTPAERDRIDWKKGDGLVPAVVQHADSGAVLMLGYMNRAALDQTLATRLVTFHSRSRQAIWVKGETSGNVIHLESVAADCDGDTLLVKGRPVGPTCHTGTATCFGDLPAATPAGALTFLAELEGVIGERLRTPGTASYTERLVAQGPARVAQKVGEEGLEVALAAVGGDEAAVIGESADLLYHLLVLLKSRGHSLSSVTAELERRHRARASPVP